jgi:iron-sulfur cluster assembly protein
MIKITPAAANQIKLSAQQGGSEGMSLRIAATVNSDDSIHYGMGFDESKEEDISVTSEDIEIIVSPVSAEILKNTTLDFVELEEGKPQFIFMNPNDPDYTPPTED